MTGSESDQGSSKDLVALRFYFKPTGMTTVSLDENYAGVTRPWFSGLEEDTVQITKGRYPERDVHRGGIDLE